jgi:hypothetical protein
LIQIWLERKKLIDIIRNKNINLHGLNLYFSTFEGLIWKTIFFYSFLNYFSMEKCGVGRGDFLEFLELFFNGEIWCGRSWCGMLLNFENYFSMEKADFFKFLELFFNRERWCGIRWYDMLFEFLEIFYFSMEKCDVAWCDFLKFLELFLNEERWHDIRWCDMLLEFSEIFFNRGRWHDIRWCNILTCWENRN